MLYKAGSCNALAIKICNTFSSSEEDTTKSDKTENISEEENVMLILGGCIGFATMLMKQFTVHIDHSLGKENLFRHRKIKSLSFRLQLCSCFLVLR